MKKLIIIAIMIFILGGGALIFWKEGILPVNKKSATSIIFVVKEGQNLDAIINSLSKENLIRNRLVFYLVIKQLGIERAIQAGDFRLSQKMSVYEIADALTHGSIDVWVTVREGLRKEEIAEIMAEKFAVSETEFNELAVEGALFPDTYLIPKSPTVTQIIELMQKNFNLKYDEELKMQAKKNNFTDEEVLILASLVEREAKYDYDRAQVASILLRRYREDYPLQVDATVQYALGYQAGEKRWWKKSLTFADLEINSRYNTYKNVGLPPAPICNPGLASIEAVINADPNTPYRFYLSDPSGKTYYAKTFAEHQSNIEKYLR